LLTSSRDTVDSVGLIPKRLPFTTSNTIVKTFRHALSLDERRSKFKANLWNRPTKTEVNLGLPDPEPNSPNVLTPTASNNLDDKDKNPRSKDTTLESDDISVFFPDNGKGKKKKRTGDFDAVLEEEKEPSSPTGKNGKLLKKPQQRRGVTLGFRSIDSNDRLMNTFERMYSQGARQTDVEEVWFAGCHCDVGGGSVSNKTRHSLARIPLRWMIREIFKAQTGMLFISDRLFEIGMDPTTLYPFVTPRPPALSLQPDNAEHRIRRHPVKEIPIRPDSILRKLKLKAGVEKPSIADVSKAPERGPAALLRSEEDEELMDALSPVYDQLKLKKGWWILEVIPLRLRYQRGDDTWVTYRG